MHKGNLSQMKTTMTLAELMGLQKKREARVYSHMIAKDKRRKKNKMASASRRTNRRD